MIVVGLVVGFVVGLVVGVVFGLVLYHLGVAEWDRPRRG